MPEVAHTAAAPELICLRRDHRSTELARRGYFSCSSSPSRVQSSSPTASSATGLFPRLQTLLTPPPIWRLVTGDCPVTAATANGSHAARLLPACLLSFLLASVIVPPGASLSVKFLGTGEPRMSREYFQVGRPRVRPIPSHLVLATKHILNWCALSIE